MLRDTMGAFALFVPYLPLLAPPPGLQLAASSLGTPPNPPSFSVPFVFLKVILFGDTCAAGRDFFHFLYHHINPWLVSTSLPQMTSHGPYIDGIYAATLSLSANEWVSPYAPVVGQTPLTASIARASDHRHPILNHWNCCSCVCYLSSSHPASLDVSLSTFRKGFTTDTQNLALPHASSLLLSLLSTDLSCEPSDKGLAQPVNLPISDFARLLLVAKQPDTTSIVNSGPFAIVVLREISYSLSISLNYLFFLVYLGRPPRGEVQLVGPAERARARRESPARWAYWGVVGYLAQGVLAAAIVAVAVLGVIWRVTANPKGVIYMTNGVIEGVLSISFLGKVLLNAWLSPLTPQWKTIRNYSPLIFALATRLGIILTSEFCSMLHPKLLIPSHRSLAGFTEASLGRLLQAIQLYILLVLVLVSPFYGPRRQDEHSEVVDTRRASSFRGLRFSKCSQWSTLNTAPGNDSRETQMPRGSPSERLSAWLTNRLTPRKDPQEDRLWNKDKPDLEAPPTPFDRNIEENDGSPIEPKFTDNPPAATWQGPYLPDPITPEGPNDPTTPITPSHVIDITENGFPSPTTLRTPPRTSRPPSDLMPPGRFIGKFEINQSYESDSDSPVYGINGIIQRRSQSKRRSRYDTNRVSAIYQLEKEKEELERSVASMAAFSPSKSELTRRTSSSEGGGGRGDAVRRDSDPSDVPASDRNLLSESIKSDFSLRDFPSPPGSVYPSNKGKALVSKLPTPPLSTKSGGPPEVSGRSRRSNDLEVVEDVQFAMVPPQMPAAASYSRRRASFPVVARESAISSVDGVPRIISAYGDSEDDFGGKRVRMSSANNRLDVTSFIGGK